MTHTVVDKIVGTHPLNTEKCTMLTEITKKYGQFTNNSNKKMFFLNDSVQSQFKINVELEKILEKKTE